MSTPGTNVYNLISEMQRQLIELEQDVFVRGSNFKKHSLPKAEQLLKYSKELIYNLRQFIEECKDEV